MVTKVFVKRVTKCALSAIMSDKNHEWSLVVPENLASQLLVFRQELAASRQTSTDNIERGTVAHGVGLDEVIKGTLPRIFQLSCAF